MNKYIVIQDKIYKISELIEDFFTLANVIIVISYFLNIGDRALLFKYFIVLMLVNALISLITSNLFTTFLKKFKGKGVTNNEKNSI